MSTLNNVTDDTVAVVLAGGKGTRLDPLTRDICKPALPFGGAYRSIDFSLSNCVNSGIRCIGVATQHKPEALLEHIDRVWRGAATDPEHFIAPWPAEERAPRSGYRGTADAVYRNLELIEGLDRRLVLVLAGDHVYKMDYRPMLERHCERGAAVTIGCVEVPVEEAYQFGVMSVDRNGRIDGFVEKPRTRAEIPAGAFTRGGSRVLASMGIYVFDADLLARVLRLDAFSSGSRHDFGGDILPRLIREADAVAYPFRDAGGGPAYWRDIGTVSAYWQAHMELLGSSPCLELDDPSWPLPAAGGGAPQATALGSGSNRGRAVLSSLVAEDCTIRGTVRRSVLFRGVEVSRGADVADAVILPGAVIGQDCRLRGVIVDGGCRVPRGTVIDRAASDRRARGGLFARGAPVVVTAEDIEANLACAIG